MSTRRESQLFNRHKRIRKRVIGTPERPRLSVHRSHANIMAQVIDDYAAKTMFSCSTLDPNFKKQTKYGGNLKAAKSFGGFFAEAMKKKGLKKIVFDRGGFLYGGRIKAFADSLREKGIEF